MRPLLLTVLLSLSILAPAASAQDAPPAAGVATGSARNDAEGPAKDQGATESAPKPAKRGKVRRPKKRREVKGPVANFPAFRVLPDGSSRVHVEISEKVIVVERVAEGRVAYRIKGASVPVRTNLLPLETSFFKTPVARIHLVEAGDDDLELVVELRQPSSVTHRLVETEGGVMLQVDFPPPAAQTAQPTPPVTK